jgi:hypothetical protein
MNRFFRTITAVVVAVLLIGLLHGAALAQTDDRLANLMQETDLKFKVLNEYSYLVPFETDNNGQIDVYVTYNNEEKDFALIYTTLLDYEDGHEFRPEVAYRALKINNDYPAVKLCLDTSHGDLDAQTEQYMRTLDAQALSLHINMIAAIADRFMTELSDLEEGNTQG